MKKFATIATIVATIATMTATTASAELYARSMTITETAPAVDIMTAVDTFGDEWVLDMTDSWRVGDVIAVVIDDMNTEDVWDDVPLSMWYTGITVDTAEHGAMKRAR